MSNISAEMLKQAGSDSLIGEAIEIKSIIPKFEGVLCKHWSQYAIVDQEFEKVTLMPSFIKCMEDVTRYIKACELIHVEAVEMHKSLPRS